MAAENISESDFNLFYRHSCDLLCVLNPEGLFVKFNDAWREILGYEPAELEDTSIIELIHPSGRADAADLFHRRTLKEEIKDYLICCSHKDGSYRWLQWNIFSEGSYLYASGRDVSDEKRKEETLQQFKTSTDHANDAIYWLNKAGGFEYINETACKKLGYTREELMKLSIMDIVPETTAEIFAGIWESYQPYKDKAYLSRTLETVHRRKDGTIYPVEVSVNHFWEHDKEYHIAHIHDLTDRKREEEALRRSEEKYRKLFENMSNSYSIYRPVYDEEGTAVDFQFIEVNPASARDIGLPADEIIGKTMKSLFPATEDYWIKLVGETVKTGVSQSFTNHSSVLDRYFEALAYSPEKDLCAVIYTDVTERVKKEEELKRLTGLNQAIIDATSNGLIFIKERKVEWVNETLLNMFGYCFEELIGQSAEIFYGDKKQFDYIGKEAYQKLLKGEIFRIELRGKKKDGTLFWCMLSSKATDPEDLSKGSLWTVEDIDERKQNEKKLYKFKASIDYTADSVFWINSQAGFDYVNEQACKSLGYTHDELMQLKVSDLDPNFKIEDFKKNWKRLSEERKFENSIFESIYIRKDGTTFPIELTAIFIWYQNNGLQIIYVRDITERKRSEEALLSRERELQRIYDIAPVGIGLIRDRKIINLNKAVSRIIGYEEKELKGRSSDFLYSSQAEYERVGGDLYQDMIIKGVGEIETELLRKDGTKIAALIAVTLLDPSEPSKGNIFTVIDITERKKHENQLKAEEERFRALADNVPGAIYMCRYNAYYSMLYLNDRVQEITGYPKEYFLSGRLNFTEIYHPDDIGKIGAAVDEAVKNKGQFEVFYRIKHKSGEWRWVHELGVGIYEDGKINYLIGFFLDVTEEKNAKERAEESEQRYKALHNASFGGITIHDKGLILDCNRGLSDITGFSYEELIGMNGLLLIAEEYRDTVMSNIKKGYEKPYDVFGVRKNGEYYPLRLEAREIPYKGRQVRSVEFRDITEQKEIEKQIILEKERAEESSYFLRESQRSGRIGSYKMVYSERYWITTETLDSIFGVEHSDGKKSINDWFEIIYAEDFEMMSNYFREDVIGKRQDFNKEYRIIRKNDQEVRWVQGIGKLYFDDNGEINSMLGTIQDITERKLIEEERRTINISLEKMVKEKTHDLETANEALKATLKNLNETQAQLLQSEKMASLGILTAGVSHEINNPLNFITTAYHGFLDMGLEDQNEDAAFFLEALKTGVERAGDIVKSLNQFSRSNKSTDEDCDIHEIIDNCLVMMRNQLKDRIEVTKNYLSEPQIISGNVGAMHQVFINLLSNAEHAIEEDGRIDIETRLSGDELIVEIIDTGCGISKDNMKNITDPFFTTKKPGKGTGLGLSITYNIVNEHGGRLEFESEENAGTTARVSLPLKRNVK